jgi:hypothetical protein
LFLLALETVLGNNIVPESLTPRSESLTWISTALLAASFLLVALSKMTSNHFVLSISKAVYKNKNVERTLEDEFPIASVSSFLLVLNYLVSCSALIYLSYLYSFNFQKPELTLLLYLPIFPGILLFWPWIALNLAGFITGEGKNILESKLNTWLFAEFAGLFYSLILLVWTFNLQWSEYFTWAFLIFSAALWLYRFLRGFLFAISKGMRWYYIILYFCTLEILPLGMVYWIVTGEGVGVIIFGNKLI